MKFDFDRLTDRTDTGSEKWNVEYGKLPMWIADMDFETAPAVKEAVVNVANSGIYGYAAMNDDYFKSMSDFRFLRHGYRFSPTEMIYSNGVVAAISSMVRRFTHPGENVVVQTPCYNIFFNSILNNGRRVLENELIYEYGEYRMDFADLEEKLSFSETTLMILCNPHNPIGKIWDKETLARVGELCKKHGVTVISDEIHSDIVRPGTVYVPFASASEICEDISLSCFSMSKAFNIAGLQSAVVAAKNPSLRKRAFRGINNDEVGEPNIFAMSANIAACRQGSEWLDDLQRYIFENKDYATEYINSNIAGLKAIRSDATYLLWVDISYYTFDSDTFVSGLSDIGLIVSSGAKFGNGGKGFIRINVATQRERIDAALECLSKYVEGLRRNKTVIF